MNRKTYRDAQPHELEALQRFADYYGRTWKDKLAGEFWPNARLWRGELGSDDNVGPTLHGIRNDLGPTWLYDVCKVKAAPKVKALTFKALPVSATFVFKAEAEFPGMARGPWVKVGRSSYRSLVDGYAHGPTHIVGTAAALVTIA